MPPPQTKRFQLDLNDQLRADIAALKLTTGDRTNAKMVQKSIRLHALLRERVDAGCQVIIRDPKTGKEQRVVDV